MNRYIVLAMPSEGGNLGFDNFHNSYDSFEDAVNYIKNIDPMDCDELDFSQIIDLQDDKLYNYFYNFETNMWEFGSCQNIVVI